MGSSSDVLHRSRPKARPSLDAGVGGRPPPGLSTDPKRANRAGFRQASPGFLRSERRIPAGGAPSARIAPMRISQSPRQRWPLRLAIIASLVLHAVVLFLAPEPPERRYSGAPTDRLPKRLDATLAPRKAQAPSAARQTPPAPPKPAPTPAKPPAVAAARKPSPPRPAEERRKILAMPKQHGATASQGAQTPKWSVQEKQEMDQFLGELDAQAKAEARARPSLAERSLSMAREFGRKDGRPDDDGVRIVERIPGSPPIDPFSLEMYFDSQIGRAHV